MTHSRSEIEGPAARAPVALVTGASGFVGGRVSRRLLEQGYRVRAIVRDGSEAPGDERIEIVRGDFVDPATAARAATGARVVVHSAATAGSDIDPVRRVNVDGTRSMVEAALQAASDRFVQISTISVYDRAGLSLIDEDSPLKTSGDPYGWTKAEADLVVLEAMARGLRATILRPGAILGAGRTSTWGTRVPGSMREGKVKLRHDGGDTIPFVHVEDLVDAVLLAIRSERAIGRVYNVADEHHTWREYTDEVRRWFDLPELDRIPEAEVAPGTYWVGSASTVRIRSELGFAPARSYADGMAEAERAWRSNVSRPEATEYAPYYGRYIVKVPDGPILDALASGMRDTLALLRSFPEERGDYRYAPDKWSAKEVLGHVIDAERVFAYRALRFARNDATPLPGFEQDDYIPAGRFGARTVRDLADELETVRQGTLHLFRHLDEAALLRRGVASENPVSVRALAYIIAGHEAHHRTILRERYLGG